VIKLSFIHGYLTPKQKQIWLMFSRKIKQSEIARILGVTKQTVNKSLSIIEKRYQGLYMRLLN